MDASACWPRGRCRALLPLIGWRRSGSASLGGWTLLRSCSADSTSLGHALYREDYGKAGFPMLPVVEPDGRRTGRQAVAYAVCLVPVSLAPAFIGVSGQVYFWTALVLGVALVWLAVRFATSRTEASARALFFGSITYLPLIWTAMIVNH